MYTCTAVGILQYYCCSRYITVLLVKHYPIAMEFNHETHMALSLCHSLQKSFQAIHRFYKLSGRDKTGVKTKVTSKIIQFHTE